MTISRRNLLKSTLLPVSAGAGALLASAGASAAVSKRHVSLGPDTGLDASRGLQALIGDAANRGVPVLLPPGRILAGGIRLPEGLQLVGMPGRSVVEWNGHGDFIAVENAANVRISGITFDGGHHAFKGKNRNDHAGLIWAIGAKNLRIEHCEITRSAAHGISYEGCSGSVMHNDVSRAVDTGIFANNSLGLEVSHNRVRDCSNNGIQIWRSDKGEDGTIVSNNRVSNINNLNGGSGQWGNGINVFRAGNVMITNNRISDCTYSAVRVNSGNASHITGNSCSRMGEVAIFVEFGYLGAVVSNNSVEQAEVGISITNYDEGGRLAVCQGNLIRGLFFRDKGSHEASGGIGISAEADVSITGNTIEGAPRSGILLGWGPYMRNLNATGNVISDCVNGIGVTVVKKAGRAIIANNIISRSKKAAIQGMAWQKRVTDDLLKPNSKTSKNITLTGNIAT